MSGRPIDRLLTPVPALCIAVAAAAALGMEAKRYVEIEPLPAVSPGRVAPVTGASAPAPLPGALRVVEAVDADPFHPERRRPDAPFPLPGEPLPATPPSNMAPPAPPLRLLGTTLLGAGRGFAVLERPGEPAKLVRTGESFAGYRLDRVERGRVTLAIADSTVTLNMPRSGS